MFLFAISSGIVHGWLPEDSYLPVVRKGWRAMTRYVDDEGRLEQVCVGTGHGDGSVRHYLTRPRETGDAHGQAALLWAGPAIIELGRRHAVEEQP
jgi:rhamnogalacturonyl hydrolase YesR